MVSWVDKKVHAQKLVLAYLGDKASIDLDKCVCRICLDLGFNERSIYSLLEQMQVVGKVKVVDGKILKI